MLAVVATAVAVRAVVAMAAVAGEVAAVKPPKDPRLSVAAVTGHGWWRCSGGDGQAVADTKHMHRLAWGSTCRWRAHAHAHGKG